MLKTHLKRWACGLLLWAVLASSVIPVSAAGRFSDVPADHWAAEPIQQCVSQQLFQGETATRFGTGNPMTRAAFVVVLDRLFGWEDVTPETGSFDDAQAPSLWYFTALETALANGAVTLQMPDFRPDDAITREEMAVMLVRALGYNLIAGLDLDLPMPFTDVTSNRGYIALAYALGIVNGTSDTTFSPDGTATREQAAVMLMRVWQKLHAQSPSRLAVLRSQEDLAVADGFEVAAIAGKRLLYSGKLTLMESTTGSENTLREAVQSSGKKALLYMPASTNALQAKAQDVAELLADTVKAGGYDGLYLDIPNLPSGKRTGMTTLTATIRKTLGDSLLYVAADLPASNKQNGYDHAALAKQADCLVIRVPSAATVAGTFPVSPIDPPEALCSAIGRLKSQADPEKLCLELTTTSFAWIQGKEAPAANAARIQELLSLPDTETYYSDRYACAYLSAVDGGKDIVIWYPTGDSIRSRLQLAAFLGISQVCVSDLDDVTPEIAAALQ